MAPLWPNEFHCSPRGVFPLPLAGDVQARLAYRPLLFDCSCLSRSKSRLLPFLCLEKVNHLRRRYCAQTEGRTS